jgi:hypothetical protein
MTQTAPPPVRHGLPTWLKVLLWTGAAVGALVAAGLLWLAAVLSGGFDDLLSGPGPSPDDRRVVDARQRSEAALQVQSSELTAAVAADGPELLSGTAGSCREGQHNWKIDDPFDLVCSQVHVTAVPMGSLGTFREQALATHDRLLAAGWQPDGGPTTGELAERSSIAWVVGEYWDHRATFYDDGYDPSDLPTAGYVREDLALSVQWLTPSSTRLDVYPADGLVLTGGDGHRVAPEAASGLLPDGHHAAVLVLRQEYFHE